MYRIILLGLLFSCNKEHTLTCNYRDLTNNHKSVVTYKGSKKKLKALKVTLESVAVQSPDKECHCVITK